MAAQTPPTWDHAALIADLRAGKQEAIDWSYKLTFDTELGRLVLAHHLMECGVGNPLGREGLEYAAGMHDGALRLADKARFDQASISVAVLTDELEGNQSDVAFHYEDPGAADDLADVDDG